MGDRYRYVFLKWRLRISLIPKTQGRRIAIGINLMPQTNNPEFWRFRAEEARTIAADMIDAEAKGIMLRIADDYDRIAKLSEEGAVKQPK